MVFLCIQSIKLCSVAAVFVWLVVTLQVCLKQKLSADPTMTTVAGASQRHLLEDQIRVFSSFVENPVSQKTRRDLDSINAVALHALTSQEQGEFLKQHPCANVVERFDEFILQKRPHLAQELYKYCALHQFGGVYLDGESPLLVSLEALLTEYPLQNIAVFSDGAFEKTLHGSLLVLREPRSAVAAGMIQVLMETPVETLDSSPLLLPKKLYSLVSSELNGASLVSGSNGRNWVLLDQRCSVDPIRTSQNSSFSVSTGLRLTHHCPKESGYCCHVQDQRMGVVLMTRHPLLPYQVLPNTSTLAKPYHDPNFPEEDLPFIATVQERIMPRPQSTPVTPNFFDVLFQNDCLPKSKECSSCLREKKGATCKSCRKYCGCYCKALCHTDLQPKFVSKEITVTPPLYARDPNRIIPRIIHQTWFENVEKEKYPNMSRLIESFKSSGWEYKFYNDDDAKEFLQKHFPPQVLEAYEALIPGAFKADLFRYCVLLIYGGVYSDMDVMLEANLDAAVGPDVGFMVPVDEPGKLVDKRMCLWNGFIAAAPGHPYLAKVVETVVNNIRNRFTSVDMDNSFCPNPELSILHAFDTLFTAGPCILGGTINKVLGRHGQTQYEPGELNPWSETTTQQASAEKATSFVLGLDEPHLRIPGRTIVLKQNKWDMGAHRFTLLEKNLVVAATDMPDYDDRENMEDGKEHYSKIHVKIGIYGLEKLYTNKHKANEDIRILVNGQGNQYKNQW